MRVPENTECLLLNSDWKPLKVISWKKAITQLMKGNVIQVDFYSDLEASDGKNRKYAIPSVVSLKKYVHRQNHSTPLSGFRSGSCGLRQRGCRSL